MIITLDGPGGAGKSSAAKALAQRLGFEFLDTGAMYRAVALEALKAHLDPRDVAAMERLMASVRLEMLPGRVVLNGEDVSTAIRTEVVTRATGAVADSPVVRRYLAARQREIAQGRDIVCEGRDQGTVVFPDAACKFFLTASLQERARRRQRELAARGEQVSLAEVLAALEERDRRDAARDLAPMRPAADAVVVDSTGKTPEEVLAVLEAEARRRRPPQTGLG